MKTILLSLLAVLVSITPAQAETVRFEAADGVTVTAEFNTPDGEYSTTLVLYHMAGASRGEYGNIAKQLNTMGYATLAVDQRSGGKINGVNNETVKSVGKSKGFVEAIPDLLAASGWARNNTDAEHVGVMGSSYSAGLVLVLAAQEAAFADAVMSFSPGEYYGSNDYVGREVANVSVPVFLTSARGEVAQWQSFEQGVSGPVVGFVPTGSGRHGASALDNGENSKEYWAALTSFLNQYLPAG